METLNDLGKLALRFGFGLPMAFGHGFTKLFSFTEQSHSFPDPYGIGPVLSMGLVIFAELVCSLLVVFGAFTRLAAIPLLFTMGTAVWKVHFGQAFNTFELPFIYAIGFLAIALLGAGSYSFDRLILEKR
ncbi:MAG: DoxX family protein [Myxococcaceae bacterium]|nr:DoxX family protein [Myxococcaceae bacterium]MBH2006016.1 DoxX family protein [Myxococcaceae bacterium]